MRLVAALSFIQTILIGFQREQAIYCSEGYLSANEAALVAPHSGSESSHYPGRQRSARLGVLVSRQEDCEESTSRQLRQAIYSLGPLGNGIPVHQSICTSQKRYHQRGKFAIRLDPNNFGAGNCCQALPAYPEELKAFSEKGTHSQYGSVLDLHNTIGPNSTQVIQSLSRGELFGASWALLMHNSLQQAAMLPRHCHTLIRYEDLVRDGQKAVARISSFLGGIPFPNNLMAAKGAMRDVWRDRLSSVEINDIERMAHSVMLKLGYMPT